MDNRWKFLYYLISELVGTHKESTSRERKDRYKRGAKCLRKIPYMMVIRDVERIISSEASEPMLPRKAAIVHTVPVP